MSQLSVPVSPIPAPVLSLNLNESTQSIKLKNSEGHDRIPQILLIDGVSVLLQPLTSLFDNKY